MEKTFENFASTYEEFQTENHLGELTGGENEIIIDEWVVL